MDIKKYIASGILEQYVLGTLNELEAKEVVLHLKEFPELQIEVAKIESAMEKYAQAHSVNPPAGIEASIMDKIKNIDPEKPTKKTYETASSSSHFLRYFSYALGLALLAAIYLATNLKTKINNLDRQHLQLQEEHVKLQKDCAEIQEKKSTSEKYLAFIQDPNTKEISMKGTDLASTALSKIYWNPFSKKSYLRTIDMPEVPSGKQYQLWAIVEGNPVDMGVFNLNFDSTGLIEIPHIESAQAFAVTLENIGGVASPTMEQMYVIGENS